MLVRAEPGATIGAFIPVYVSAFIDGFLRVKVADANSSTTLPASGILQDSITDTVEGRMVISGTVSGMPTSAWTLNDLLYVAAGGGLSTSKPSDQNLRQPLCQVVRVDGLHGMVKITSHVTSAALSIIPTLQTGDLLTGDAGAQHQKVVIAASSLVGRQAAGGVVGIPIAASSALVSDSTANIGSVALTEGSLLTVAAGEPAELAAPGADEVGYTALWTAGTLSWSTVQTRQTVTVARATFAGPHVVTTGALIPITESGWTVTLSPALSGFSTSTDTGRIILDNGAEHVQIEITAILEVENFDAADHGGTFALYKGVSAPALWGGLEMPILLTAGTKQSHTLHWVDVAEPGVDTVFRVFAGAATQASTVRINNAQVVAKVLGVSTTNPAGGPFYAHGTAGVIA